MEDSEATGLEETPSRRSLGSAKRRKAKFGGMEVSDVAKIKALEDENRRFKRIVADQALNIDVLNMMSSGTF